MYLLASYIWYMIIVACVEREVQTTKTTTALNAESSSRRQAFAAVGAAFIPAIANAAAGKSPRFSVFGVFGDGTSYSEGGAYGSDQSSKTFSPYSVYGAQSKDSLYVKGGDADYVARKKAILKETAVRLDKLPAYIEKKKWFEVKNELDRYMYETR